MEEPICRICYETENLLKLNCLCVNPELQFIHLNCADKWFSNRMEIFLSGKLKEPTLLVSYSCLCEICNEKISNDICREIYSKYDKNYKTIKKTIN